METVLRADKHPLLGNQNSLAFAEASIDFISNYYVLNEAGQFFLVTYSERDRQHLKFVDRPDVGDLARRLHADFLDHGLAPSPTLLRKMLDAFVLYAERDNVEYEDGQWYVRVVPPDLVDEDLVDEVQHEAEAQQLLRLVPHDHDLIALPHDEGEATCKQITKPSVES
jgi:hypothetical protein